MKIKKFLGLLLCLFAFVFLGVSELKAALPSSNQIVQNVQTQKIQLAEGVEYYLRKDKTAPNGDITKEFKDQNVQAIVVPKSSETVELVVWAAGTNDHWDNATLRETIIDFERRNPGYKVLAGVNGDFFDIKGTFEPNSGMVSAGDVWKKDQKSYPNLGIFPDKSYIVGHMTTNKYMSLKTMNGRVVTNEFKIDKENALPTGDQVAFFFPGSAQKLNVTGYTVYKGEYDIYRVSKNLGYVDGGPLGKFIKGTIVEKSSNLTQIDSIPKGTFYIVTNNSNVDNSIQVGTYVKAEYSLNGAWTGVENSIGLNATLLQNGQIIESLAANKDVHPRCLIGMREDGTFVLMTVDGRQPLKGANGVTYVESAALLQQLGCVEGYNLDGGGSVTSIIRNEKGELQTMNIPSDGSERGLGNTILVVMREHNIQATNIQPNSFTIEPVKPIVNGTIQNLKAKIEGGEYINAVDGKVTFTGLQRQTDYLVYFTYEINDASGRILHSGENKLYVATTGQGVPEISRFRFSKTTSNSVSIRYEIKEDPASTILAYYIQYGDKKFDLDELDGTATITGLEAGDYEFRLVVEYRYGGVERTFTSDVLTYTVKGGSTGGGSGSGCNMGASVAYLGFVSALAAGIFVVLRRKH